MAVPGLVDAKEKVAHLLVDLAYAGTDNFMKRNVYGKLERCFLQTEAAEMLAAANTVLEKRAPGIRLLAWDCARPRSVQKAMWKVVRGTPQQSYVANPNTKTGSIHNYGCAIDLTLADARGRPLDMGTGYDHFGRKAQPRYEARLRASGELSAEALGNRLLLREVMVRAGFYPISNEWWHFNCALPGETRARFQPVP